jgi:hypothetical protein
MGISSSSSKCKFCQHDHYHHENINHNKKIGYTSASALSSASASALVSESESVRGSCQYIKFKKKVYDPNTICRKCNHNIGKKKYCSTAIASYYDTVYAHFPVCMESGGYILSHQVDVEFEKYCQCDHTNEIYEIVDSCLINCNECGCKKCQKYIDDNNNKNNNNDNEISFIKTTKNRRFNGNDYNNVVEIHT